MKFRMFNLLKWLTIISTIGFSQLSNAAAHEGNKHILIIISSHHYGYALSEVVKPYRLFKQANISVSVASPFGAPGRAAGEKYLSKEDGFYYNQLKPKLTQPIALSQVIPNQYDAVYVAGGAGPMMDLYKHPQIQRIVGEMYMDNKIVAADCHGPVALAGVTLPNGEYMIKDKKLTAKSIAEESNWGKSNYPFMLESRLKEHQAIFSAAKPKQPWVVRDGNLLTGQNPASAEPLAEQLVQMLIVN